MMKRLHALSGFALSLAAGCLLLGGSAASAQVTMFYCLNSTSTNLTPALAASCWISDGGPIQSFSFGVSRQYNPTTGVVGTPSISEFTFSLVNSPASPRLVKDMLTYTVIPTVSIGVNGTLATGVTGNITYLLSNVHITSVEDSASAGGGSSTSESTVSESVSMSYQSIEVVDNTTSPPTSFTWPPPM